MGLAASMLQAQFKSAHDWVKGTMGSPTADQLHYNPDGKPVPIGAQFVHVVTTEDFFINMMQGKDPLMATDFAGNIGVSEMPPQGDWSAWAGSVQVDMDKAMAYAEAVFSATEAYVGGLSDDQLSEVLDLSGMGFGTPPRHGALSILLLNTFSHAGEISVIKGLQGLKGYPI